MKKLLSLLVALSLVLTLAACTKEVEVIKEVEVEVEVEKAPIEIPAEVTMANIDDFVERVNVQLVDLRNFADKMKGGYIAGFEFIPYFDYLENNVLVTNGWDWKDENVLDADSLEALFDKDADAIFLMCMSGTRAGHVKSALESIGYTNVYNVGGFKNYTGSNEVEGDGEWYAPALPATVDMTNVDSVLEAKDVQLVDLRNFEDKMNGGYIAGFEFIPFFHYLENADILVRTDGDFTFAPEDIHDEDALRALFNEDARAIYLMCMSGGRAGYVEAALTHLGYTNVHNIGGWKNYNGNNKVEGDGEYVLKPAA